MAKWLGEGPLLGVPGPGDFLKWYSHSTFNFAPVQLLKTTVGDWTDVDILGLPIVASTGEIVIATAEGTATGIVCQKGKVDIAGSAATTNAIVWALVKGPATLYQNGLPANDPADAAYDLAALATQLEASGYTVWDTPTTHIYQVKKTQLT